jgi:hypothetical protein
MQERKRKKYGEKSDDDDIVDIVDTYDIELAVPFLLNEREVKWTGK